MIDMIYTMGDSLTQGYPSQTGGYQASLVSRLDPTWQTKNKGISANSTSQMLSRFQTDISNNPDAKYVIIWGGVNDALNDVSATTTESNLQAMYNIAHAAGIKVIAVNITPFKNSPYWTIQRQGLADSVNSWIASSTPQNVDYKVDAYSAVVDTGNPYQLQAQYSSDWVHMTDLGYSKVAEYIANSVIFSHSWCDAKTYSANGIFSSFSIGNGASASNPIFKMTTTQKSFLVRDSSNTNSTTNVLFEKTRGTVESPTQTLSGDVLVNILGRGIDNNGTYQNSAGIQFGMEEDVTASNKGAYLKFSTAPKGGGSLSQVLAFDGDGNSVFGRLSQLSADTVKGFSYMPTVQGTPTGTPILSYTGKVPMVVDAINSKLCFYIGSWKCTQLQ